jgi:hypothetical protein
MKADPPPKYLLATRRASARPQRRLLQLASGVEFLGWPKQFPFPNVDDDYRTPVWLLHYRMKAEQRDRRPRSRQRRTPNEMD